MKRVLFLALFLPVSAHALNITGAWFSNGTQKIARQDLWPNGTCSTCAITDNWDGVKAKLYGADNETLLGLFYLQNASGIDATNVSVSISSFTGSSGGSIIPVAVSSGSLYDASAIGPLNLFYVRYLQIIGMSQLQWDPSLYEERDLPPRFRNPCTPNVNNDCNAFLSGPSLWSTRPDANKFYPDILVPNELMTSSFTVAASSSQAIGLDVRIEKGLPAGVYTGQLTVKENGVVSRVVTIQITVYNFTLPDQPSMKVIGDISGHDINLFHQNNSFPSPGGVALTTREHYYQFARRHGVIPIGDDQINYCGNGAQDSPCPEYMEQISGSLFTAARGYAGRSLDLPVPFYMLATYGEWNHPAYWSSTQTGGGSTGFCTNIAAWSTALSTFTNTTVAFYTTDEPNAATMVSSVEKWALWMSTSCTMSGKFINSWVTSNWTTASSSAPHINMPAATQWIATGYSINDWIAAATRYETAGSTQGWMYNGHPSWSGTVYATEDTGVSAIVPFVAAYKKGVSGMFLWELTSWDIDGGGSPHINDLFNVAKTFGYDTYPSTSATKGHFGFGFGNGDGVLLYPGTDSQDSPNSYSVDGPLASLRFKLVRSGIQFVDYFTMAAAVNQSSTTAILNSLVPEVLWEHQCFTSSDCSYSYGGRSWTDDPQTWEAARERLAVIIQGPANHPAATNSSESLTGHITINGNVRMQ